MAGRLLFEDGFGSRQVELSQVVHGFGTYATFRQLIVSLSNEDAVCLYAIESEQETVKIEMSAQDVETLYAALQEYKQVVASLGDLGDLDEHPF